MAGKITDKELYQGKPNPFVDAAKGGEELIKIIDKLIAKSKELSSVGISEIKSNTKEKTEDYRKLSKSIEDVSNSNKNAIELEKQKAILEKELSKLQQQNIKVEQEKLKLSVQQTKENERLAKSEEKQRKELEKQSSSYQKLNKELTTARNKAKDIGATYGTTSKEFKKAAGEVLNLDSKIKKIDKSLGLSQREVGNYASAFKGLGGAILGVAGGVLSVRAFFNVVKQGVAVFSEFDKQVSKVQAISGASATDIKALRAQAELLGESTEKTASQVAQLQLELAKLGFNPKQIQDATGSILDLSTAIDADLAQSATVVGSTLRAFGLDAAETSRVTDVMALSFSRSSLDINKFQNAMSTVAPVAKAFGFSLEETTSLLAQLSDAGFDASSAGTATRNILLNLADTNGVLAKRLGGSVNNIEDLLTGLSKLNNEGVDLNETLQLTDKRSVAAFNRFLEATDSTRKLTSELNNAAGSATKMANIMRDNLAGDADKARSAVEGLQINIGKKLNPALRGSTQGFTEFVGKLNELVKIKASEELRLEQLQLGLLVNSITGANTTQESRNRLLDDLQKKYPDFLDNLDKEKVSNEELRDRLIEVNAEYLKKINQLVKQELIAKNQNKIVKLQLEELETIKEITKLEDLRNKIGFIAFQKRTEQARMLRVYTDDLGENRAEQKRLADELQKDIDILNNLISTQGDLTTSNNEVVESTNKKTVSIEKELTEYEKLLKSLSEYEDQKKKITLFDTQSLKVKQDEIDKVKEQISVYEGFFKLFEDKPEDLKIETEIITVSDQTKGIFSDLEKAQTAELASELAARQSLYNQHYDSLLGLFLNFRLRQDAENQNFSAAQIAKQEEENAKIESAVSDLAGALLDIYNTIATNKINALQREIDAQNTQISELQSNIQTETSLQESGSASNIAIEKKRLAALQEERKKNLKEQKELQKEQERVNLLTQVSSLATAVANIISGFSEIPIVGVILGLAAAAAAVAGFASIKSDAESSVVAEEGDVVFKKGTKLESGKRHKAGGNKYSSAEFEEGEAVSVFSRSATSKHKNDIIAFNNALNNDQFEMYKASLATIKSNSVFINNDYSDLLQEQRNTNMLLKSRVVPVYINGKLTFYNPFGNKIKSHV